MTPSFGHLPDRAIPDVLPRLTSLPWVLLAIIDSNPGVATMPTVTSRLAAVVSA